MNIGMLYTKFKDLLNGAPVGALSAEDRSRERYRLIALSGSSSVVSKLITSLIGLFTIPITINYLGKEQFGLWMVISSLVLWIQLSDFGIVNGLTNALAEAYGNDDTSSSSAYISSAVMITSIISFISIPFILIFIKFIPWNILFNINDLQLLSMANTCFLVASIVFIIGFPLSLVNRIYIANQLGYIPNLTSCISSVFGLIGILISVKLKLSLPYLVLIVSSGPIIANIGAWLYMPKALPWCQVRYRFITRKALRRIARSSIPLFIFQIGSLLVNEMVNIVVAQVGSLSMVADYNVLLRIYLVIFSLGYSLSSPFYPAIRDAFERKERSWIIKSAYRLMIIRTATVIIPTIVLLIGGDWIIKIWIRQPLDSHFGITGWSFFLMTIFLSSIGSSLGEILLGLDVIWSQIWVVFLSALVIISGMFYMIPRIGLTGIYVSFSLSSIYPILWGGNKLKKTLRGI